MARIDPLALATKGIKATVTDRTDELGLATKGVLVTGGIAPPIVRSTISRMWVGGIGVDVYGRYDRG